MACCGQGRRQIRAEARPALTGARGPRPRLTMERAEPAVQHPGSYFEYVGPTGLTVRGPVTGRRYRFAGHGAVAAVDARDAPSLAAVPRLRRLA